MIKYLKIFTRCFMLCTLTMSLANCSQEQLISFKTYNKKFGFQLSNKFSLYKKAPDLNFFDNGKYRIEIETFPKPNQVRKKQYEEFQADSKRAYRNSSFMTFNPMKVPVQNDNGYPYLAFSGGGKDRSIIWPSYFEGYFFMMQTPHNFVNITLKHTARTSNAMDKEQALEYIKPLLKSFREK